MDTEGQRGVLITGGRGFIGRSAGKLLQRHGYRVTSVDVTPAGNDGNEIGCDIADSEQLWSVFQRERIDAVIHLAAILPTAAQRDPLLATRVNVQGSLNLMEAAREFGVRRIIFGSSLSVYGSWPEAHAVSEADRAAPEDLYGAAKLYVEQLGRAYRRAHSVEFVSLRMGRVVGPGAQSMTSAWRSEIFECPRTSGAKEVRIPYAASERILLVHVKEVANMLLTLLRAQQLRHAIYNAACESVTVGELQSEVQRLNPSVRVKMAGQEVSGNPRRVDWSRFAGEFGFAVVPIFKQLAEALRVEPLNDSR